jgi:hypothetical protein
VDSLLAAGFDPEPTKLPVCTCCDQRGTNRQANTRRRELLHPEVALNGLQVFQGRRLQPIANRPKSILDPLVFASVLPSESQQG